MRPRDPLWVTVKPTTIPTKTLFLPQAADMPASGQHHPSRRVPSLINTSQMHIRIITLGSDLGVHLRLMLRRPATKRVCALFLRWFGSPYIAIKELFQWTLIYSYSWLLTYSTMCYHLTWANQVFSGCIVSVEIQGNCLGYSRLVLKASLLDAYPYTFTGISHTWHSRRDLVELNTLGKVGGKPNYCSHKSIFANRIFFFRICFYLMSFKYILLKITEQ